MKVSLETVEMSDEQREQLANILDGKVSKRKATRTEAKAFVWAHGATWEETLADMADGTSGTSDEDEDLIGADELDDLL